MGVITSSPSIRPGRLMAGGGFPRNSPLPHLHTPQQHIHLSENRFLSHLMDGGTMATVHCTVAMVQCVSTGWAGWGQVSTKCGFNSNLRNTKIGKGGWGPGRRGRGGSHGKASIDRHLPPVVKQIMLFDISNLSLSSYIHIESACL